MNLPSLILVDLRTLHTFYRATLCVSAVFASSVRSSFCHVRVLYPDGCRYRQTSFSARYSHNSNFCPLAPIPNSKGTPSAGASNTPEVGQICDFDWNRHLSRKRYEIGPWLLWNVNRKSQVADRSVSVPMTLSDLERRDAMGHIFNRVSNNACTVLPRTTKFCRITRGEGPYF